MDVLLIPTERNLTTNFVVWCEGRNTKGERVKFPQGVVPDKAFKQEEREELVKYMALLVSNNLDFALNLITYDHDKDDVVKLDTLLARQYIW